MSFFFLTFTSKEYYFQLSDSCFKAFKSKYIIHSARSNMHTVLKIKSRNSKCFKYSLFKSTIKYVYCFGDKISQYLKCFKHSLQKREDKMYDSCRNVHFVLFCTFTVCTLIRFKSFNTTYM